jgi:ATP-binding cassette subfamily F protein uup
MLDRVSTVVLGLDGQGSAERFADYSQWETWQAERQQAADTSARVTARATATAEPATLSKRKLSYLEAREYSTIEQRVAAAEQVLEAKRLQAEDPAIASDSARLVSVHAELEEVQKEVDELYARWAELEKKQA